MFAQKEIVLAEHETNHAMLRIIPKLHFHKQTGEGTHYKGKIEFQLINLKGNTLSKFFLPKQEAKYLFHRILHESLLEPIFYFGGEKRKEFVAKVLNIAPNFTQENKIRNIKIQIDQGEGGIVQSGDIRMKGKPTQTVEMYLPLNNLKQIALECIDYIRHEEIVAQLKGNPLCDQLVYKPFTTEETPRLVESFTEMIEENEEEQIKEQNPNEVLSQANALLMHYVYNLDELSLSKDELDKVLDEVHEINQIAKTLRLGNQTR